MSALCLTHFDIIQGLFKVRSIIGRTAHSRLFEQFDAAALYICTTRLQTSDPAWIRTQHLLRFRAETRPKEPEAGLG